MLAGTNFDNADIAGAEMEDTLSDKPHGLVLGDLGVSLEELLRRYSHLSKATVRQVRCSTSVVSACEDRAHPGSRLVFPW